MSAPEEHVEHVHPSQIVLCLVAACFFVFGLMQLLNGFLNHSLVMVAYVFTPTLLLALSMGGIVYSLRHLRAMWARKAGLFGAALLVLIGFMAFGSNMAMFGSFLEHFQSYEARMEVLAAGEDVDD